MLPKPKPENIKVRNHLEELGLDGTVILMDIL
jgi:hypothetical protein